MMQTINIKDGGTIKFDDGTDIIIKPHSERVWLSVWHNSAMVETLCYSQQQENSVNSDRIHLLIRDGNGVKLGYLMNIEDANSIILGLSRAISQAIDMGIPVRETTPPPPAGVLDG